MNRLLFDARDQLRSAKNTVCLERARLVTEAYRLHETEPFPILRAKAFEYVLRSMTLDLDSNPIFAGNTSTAPKAWMLLPEYGFIVPEQAIVENPDFDGFLDGDAIPADLRTFWKDRSIGWGGGGVGHLSIDLSLLLSRGLSPVIEEAERLSNEDDPEKRSFREGCSIACRAVVNWAHRYADEAEKRAFGEVDPEKASAFRRVADACRRVPEHSARNLFEALQSITLVHLAMHIEGQGYSTSLGLMDRALLPYYRDDEDATDLLSAFILKIAANSLWGSHFKTQCITLGATNSNGEGNSDSVILKILEACDLMRVPDPHVFIRWSRSLSESVKKKALSMLADGCGMPMFVGDEQTVAGLIEAGVPAEDALEYCIVGCNELGIPGKMLYLTSVINGASLLRDVLVVSVDGLDSMEAIFERLREAAHRQLKPRVEWRTRGHYLKTAKKVPTPFTSALMDGCLARGKDLHEEVTLDFPVVTERGFTNLVNALAALDKLVFKERRLSIADIRQALLAQLPQ